jgi:1-aminocyclopropane-1-carboxylate deaminase/D-cysteine desulfhydrase-like pyridoxal-dependent ACC family enzyme
MNWSESESTDISLFRRYPELARKLPYINLGVWPTPVHPLNCLGIEDLWIKRDDQSSPVYGGNKIRKLAFILAEARRRKARHLITLGGIGTHHGLACALFSHQLGIDCTLLLYHQPVTVSVKRNLLLLQKYGARLVYEKRLWRTMAGYYLLWRIRFPSAYYVYPGGSSALGSIGYVDAAFELKDQIDRGVLPEPAVVFCPLGSGGSLAGLSLGLQLAGVNTRVVGVRVIASHMGPFPACTAGTVAKQIKHAYGYLKKRCQDLPAVSIRVPAILNGFFGRGYGMPSTAGTGAHRLMKEKQGIELEPTYTAKTFAAVIEYCRNRQRGRGPVLYWHTYNSVDLSAQAEDVDYRTLPRPLRGFIEQKSVAC